MTTDEKRIKVLEWMGWKPFRVKIDDEWSYDDGKYKTYWKDLLGCEHRELPPLTLDWVHEVWLKLTLEQKKVYMRTLSKILGCTFANHYNILDIIEMENATAEQRLDAMVETIGEK